MCICFCTLQDQNSVCPFPLSNNICPPQSLSQVKQAAERPYTRLDIQRSFFERKEKMLWNSCRWKNVVGTVGGGCAGRGGVPASKRWTAERKWWHIAKRKSSEAAAESGRWRQQVRNSYSGLVYPKRTCRGTRTTGCDDITHSLISQFESVFSDLWLFNTTPPLPNNPWTHFLESSGLDCQQGHTHTHTHSLLCPCPLSTNYTQTQPILPQWQHNRTLQQENTHTGGISFTSIQICLVILIST